MIPQCWTLDIMLQVHTYRAKPPPATPDILKCVLELLLAMSDSADLRQMHAKVRSYLLSHTMPGCTSCKACLRSIEYWEDAQAAAGHERQRRPAPNARQGAQSCTPHLQ